MADSDDLQSLLSSPTRDFLLHNNGEQVKIDSLKGKILGMYFSAAWCGPCRHFTPQLIELYDEIYPNESFEIVFVTSDKDEDSFKDYFSEMPWLAIPFTDSETCKRLNELFKVKGIPSLVMLDENGKAVNTNAERVILSYVVKAYPFKPERMKEVKEEEERARREQTLKSVFATLSRSSTFTYVYAKNAGMCSYLVCVDTRTRNLLSK